ncbi:hypothetical protein DYBT9275_02510 [Dyadobacter sp. CECT 9275]|uniref:Neutral/alkaline non-lysosomal ceramidase N-terminal domain-containing protein n=1 Tax=Dyadobacter helix TaxID=2822344 RepID=A0A916NBW2_9BACT|nr:hypothetical protein [Dyadobacter sp. CECT 9275]CAG5000675.1 hypothetical protein DYBT9275_02510 [Dyadobacter sp. CECT 9275]
MRKTLLNSRASSFGWPGTIFTTTFLFVLTLLAPTGWVKAKSNHFSHTMDTLRLSVFDVDVTPPVGSPLAYDIEINKWDLGLRARGIVLLGAGQPVVLCAVDWLEIGNEGMDQFKNALAVAAGTIPQRVAVHVLHQHDAPRYDAGAELILIEAGIDPAEIRPTNFDGVFPREALRNLTAAVKASLVKSEPVTHIGLGKAQVYKVASNRNIYGKDGKVRVTRMSTTRDSVLRAEPEGLIDPELSMVSFWNNEKPVAVLSYYATHPQSYYRTGVVNPDFPGVARFYRQLAEPDPLHVHFNGAGGNIAAGKYNDGSRRNRLILAERLADGMKRAWESTKRQPLTAGDIGWTVEPVALPPAKHLYKMQEDLKKDRALLLENRGNARTMAWLRRSQSGKKIEIGCLKLKNARILYMPGELFVEYQLAAKAHRPDLFVAMAAYGDLGPGYIGTAMAYEKGGYEVSELASNVAPEVEPVLLKAIHVLLEK